MDQLLSVLKLPKEALFSTLGRTAARALESVWAGNTLQYFFDRLMRNLKSGDTATANVTLWEPDTWLHRQKALVSARRRVARWGTG